MDALPHENVLTALGGVAAAFVGFSLVVEVLRPRSASEARRLYSLRDVAELGLAAIAASFLPLVIHAYGASVGTTWRLASVGFLFLWGVGLAFALWRRRAVARDGYRAEPIHTAFNTALNICGNGLLLANLIAGDGSSGARYVTAVLFLLAIAGFLFVQATFGSSVNHGPAA